MNINTWTQTSAARMKANGVKPEMLALYDHWRTPAHDKRVQEFEAMDMTTSDAQGCADAEFLTKWRAIPCALS